MLPCRRHYCSTLGPKPSLLERAGMDEYSWLDSVWPSLAHFPSLYSPERGGS